MNNYIMSSRQKYIPWVMSSYRSKTNTLVMDRQDGGSEEFCFQQKDLII